MKGLLLLICLLALCAAQESKLSFISEADAGSKPTDQLIDAFSHRQDEIIRKVFGHFIEEQVRRWKKSAISDSVVREKVLGIVVGRSQDLYSSLKKFVEEKLFAKLGKSAFERRHAPASRKPAARDQTQPRELLPHLRSVRPAHRLIITTIIYTLSRASHPSHLRGD